MNSRIEKTQQSKNSSRLKLNLKDTFTHYEIVVVLISIAILFPVLSIWKYFNSGLFILENTIINLMIVLVLLAIFFFFIQRKRLNFKIVKTDLPKEKLLKIIEGTGNELQWIHYYQDKNSIVYKTDPKWTSGSWGEHIVIIINDNEVKVNSICDPDKRSSLVSMGNNKRNENVLIKKINGGAPRNRERLVKK